MEVKPKIIHIVTDEKFINSAYWQFETAFPGENVFYILVNDEMTHELKYITLQERMVLKQNTLSNLKDLANSIEADCVVFHGLFYYQSLIANRLSKQIKKCWFLFGAEFYSNPYFFKTKDLLGKTTYTYFEEYSPKKNLFKEFFRNWYYQIKNRTNSPFKEIKKAIQNMDVIGALYKEEYQLVKDIANKANGQFLKFTYYPIEKMLANPEVKVKGEHILLGNSASYSNNHLEAIDILSNINLNGKKVICPLSYGDKEYARLIQAEGELKLKNSFEALINFMPLHQYNQHLEKCGFVIMNHYRQQAVGNVMVMLWMGAKVFLDERNSLYSYLKRLNVNVYNIKEDLNEKELNNLLSNEQREHNRHILIKEIGKERLNMELHSVFKSLKK